MPELYRMPDFSKSKVARIRFYNGKGCPPRFPSGRHLEPRVQGGRFPSTSGASRWDAHNSATLGSNQSD